MFVQKVVWITGASSGIGEALAYQFAQRGSRLILSARREAELQRVKQNCLNHCLNQGAHENDVLVLPLDLADQDALPALAQQAHAQFGQIDYLLNNAGISQRSLCLDTDLDVYRKLLDIDVMGQIALTKAVLPYMVAQNSGHIAVTASVAGKVGVKMRTGYCAAKHAVMGFFDALRAELIHNNIHVTTITPGFIRTAISKNALASDGSAFGVDDDDIANGMDVNKCAQVILRGFEKGKKEIAVGEGKEMLVLWIKRFLPNLAFKLVAAKS